MSAVSREQLSLRLCTTAGLRFQSERFACIKENPICSECAERIRTQGRDQNKCPFCRQTNVFRRPRGRGRRGAGTGRDNWQGEAAWSGGDGWAAAQEDEEDEEESMRLAEIIALTAEMEEREQQILELERELNLETERELQLLELQERIRADRRQGSGGEVSGARLIAGEVRAARKKEETKRRSGRSGEKKDGGLECRQHRSKPMGMWTRWGRSEREV
eukprot:3601013-Rhodomonas_salina.2